MSFEHPRPLIVCGFMRSGTQMCATILNNSNLVELQSEVPARLTEDTFRWLQAVKLEHQRQGIEADRLYELCRSTWRCVSAPARAVRRRRVLWFGHKTPRHESWFELYESLFDHPRGRACYVYCLRNPLLVWRSYRVMPWNQSPGVREFLRGWTGSVRSFETMRTAAPDRVFLFRLDRMLAAPDRLKWLRDGLFDGLNIDIDSLRRPVDALENRNSAKAKFGFVPEPPGAEVDAIARSREVRRIVEQYLPELADDFRPPARRGAASALRGTFRGSSRS